MSERFIKNRRRVRKINKNIRHVLFLKTNKQVVNYFKERLQTISKNELKDNIERTILRDEYKSTCQKDL